MKTVDAERLLDYLQERIRFHRGMLDETVNESVAIGHLKSAVAYTDVLNWIESHLK